MTDKQEKDQTSLFYAGNHDLTARSTNLVRRGLRHLVRKESRRVNFPKSFSIGKLFVVESEGANYWWQNEWQELGEAVGEVFIPPNKKLILEVHGREEVEEVWAGNCYDYAVEYFTDLSPLAELNPNDLQGLDLSRVSVSRLSAGASWGSLEHLQELTGLEWLSLHENKISDEDLAFLSKMTSLRYLDLSDTEVCGSALYGLKNSKLRELNLNTTYVSDLNGLGFLNHLPYLEKLNLGGNQITYHSLYDLSTLTNLKKLVIDSDYWDNFELKELDDSLPSGCEIAQW